MNIKLLQSFALFSIVFSTTVQAANLSYSSVTVDYQLLNIYGTAISRPIDGDSINFSSSIPLNTNIAFTAGYGTAITHTSVANNVFENDIDVGLLGLLYHIPVSNKADFVATINQTKTASEIKTNGKKTDAKELKGHSASFGVRTMVIYNLEIDTSIVRSKTEDLIRNALSVQAGWYVGPLFSVNAGYIIDSRQKSLLVGASKFF